ncbi:uncharacterized membrane protein YqaE (UPF0057 family) [Lewinella aquimaris]|uniref:Uncharacterized membrane protein YqaE (UPF0057 family) n=1 Tax=Neolewinella aquimaris TaxID=1835722 RepID=A0A840EE40_9BACT|nr:YqaE/Pmp3 family membrane protein [Neolewinella aquimaris]MBB4079206.1 uncharacterized membrane protein YqaE (UPF0057 family) [Neolewinella aquimaris]
MSLRTFTLSFLLVFMVFGSTHAAIVVPTPATPAAETAAEAAALDAVNEYRESLKEMSGKERRQLKREQRKAVKNALEDYRDADTNTLLLVLVTILLPPLGVLLYEGELTSKFWIALLLTLLFYLPGLIYALLVIFGNA